MLQITLTLKNDLTDEEIKYQYHDSTSTIDADRYNNLSQDNYRIHQALKRAEEQHNEWFSYVSHKVVNI